MVKRIVAAGCVLALMVAGSASAVQLTLGNIVMDIDGGFSPRALPAKKMAPIKAWGSLAIKTKDGSWPPVLKTMRLEFDKNGDVETRGLPYCTKRKLQDTITRDARRACGKAIVGSGMGKAVVTLPDSRPIEADAPLTIFNGPKKGGDPTVLAHAYMTYPAPTTYVVPIRIYDIKRGRYGHEINVTIPKIAGGWGIPLSGEVKIGHTWKYKGKKLSYIKAMCKGGRLQARGFFDFNDGSKLNGSVFNGCKVKR
jgi:hypothetical protein